MRDQLSKYVELLFAGTTGTEDIRQEILQNSLDRFDDLVAQGKSPEAAYRLTIGGIGDINEILGQSAAPAPAQPASPAPEEETPQPPVQPSAPAEQEDKRTKLLRSIAISMYILCTIPVIMLEEIGLCITLLLIAAATAILVYIGKDEPETENQAAPQYVPAQSKSTGRKITSSVIWLAGLAIYFSLSFATGAWYITWLIFPMIGCVNGVARSIFDLKEGGKK